MYLLNNFLKGKVENVLSEFLENKEQMEFNVHILDKITLKSVHIKESAVNKYLEKAPIYLKDGNIDELVLDCSFDKILSTSATIKITGLHLELELEDYRTKTFSRESLLQDTLAAMRAYVDDLTKVRETFSNSYIKSLVEKVFDNLQLQICDIAITLSCDKIIDKPKFRFEAKSFNFYTIDPVTNQPMFFNRNDAHMEGLPVKKKINLQQVAFSILDERLQKQQNRAAHKIHQIETAKKDEGSRYSNNLDKLINKKNKTIDIKRFSQVFKFSVDIDSEIKTQKLIKKDPKYKASIAIIDFKINLHESHIHYIINLLNEVSEFNKKYLHFRNFEVQRPLLSISEIKQNFNKDDPQRSIMIRRWLFYTVNLVIKQNYLEEREDIFQRVYHTYVKGDKSRLTKFLMEKFGPKLQEKIDLFFDGKPIEPEQISNCNEVIDLETILLSLPEPQLKYLISKYCDEKIRQQRLKNVNKSTIKKALATVGITQTLNEQEQLKLIVEQNLEKDESQFAYILHAQIKFNKLTINLNSYSGSQFQLRFINFNFDYEHYERKMNLSMQFMAFAFDIKSNNNHYSVCASGNQESNFFELELKSKDVEKINSLFVEIKIASITLNVHRNIFYEVKEFLSTIAKIQQESHIGEDMDIQTTIQMNFNQKMTEKARDMFIFVNVKSSSIILIFDDANTKKLRFDTGDLKVNFNSISSDIKSNNDNNVDCSIENTQVTYLNADNKYEIFNLVLFSRLNMISQPDKVIYNIGLINKRLHFNYVPVLLIELKSCLYSFINSSMLSEIQTAYVLETVIVPMSIDPNIALQQWEPAVLSVLSNKRLAMGTSNFSYQKLIKDIEYHYYNRSDHTILEVHDREANKSFYFSFDSDTKLLKFLDAIKKFQPQVEPETQKNSDEAVKKDINLEVFTSDCKIDIYNDVPTKIYSFEPIGIVFIMNPDFIKFNIDHIIFLDYSFANKTNVNTMLHIGKMTFADELFFNYSKFKESVNYENDMYNDTALLDRINKLKNRSLNDVKQKFYQRSLFSLRQNIANMFRDYSKQRLEDEDFAGLRLFISLKGSGKIELNIQKVLILWNIIFLNSLLKISEEARKIFSIPNEDKKKMSRKTSNISKYNETVKSLNRGQSLVNDQQSKYTEFEEDEKSGTFNQNGDSENDKKDGELNVRMKIDKLMILNVNESVFQSEIQLDNLIIIYKTLKEAKFIKLYSKKMEINDLTNYPFTKRKYEMQNINNIVRHRIIYGEAREPDKQRLKMFSDRKQLYKLFTEHFLIVNVTIKSEDQIEEDKVKTQADVFIHNLHVNYYQQVMFRLINFLTCSVLPFVNPDVIPENKEEILKRIEMFLKTLYKVYLYDVTLYLKPNFLVEQKMKIMINEIFVENKIIFSYDGRDKSGLMRQLYSESIGIIVSKVKGYGYHKEKLLISTDELVIDFNKFLFTEETKRLMGLEYFLDNINFGNKISISCREMNVSLFKNDFIFMMTLLFNNINNDDLMDKYLMADYQVLSYATPLQLELFFENLNVQFRYEKAEQEKRSFCTFSLPAFSIYMEKNIKDYKEIKLSIKEVIANGIEVFESSKERLLNIPFIRSVIKKQERDQYNLARRDDSPLKRKKILESSFENFNNAGIYGSREDIFTSNNLLDYRISAKTIPQRINSTEDGNKFQESPIYDMVSINSNDLTMNFELNISIDNKGNKDILVAMEDTEIILIPALLTNMVEFTRMCEEMYINTIIKPNNIEYLSDMKFTVKGKNLFLLIPNDFNFFYHKLYLYIDDLEFNFIKSNKPFSQNLYKKLYQFMGSDAHNRTMDRDELLQGMINTYFSDKFTIAETLMEAKIGNLDMFVIEDNDIIKLFNYGRTYNLSTNLNVDHFDNNANIDGSNIRYILNKCNIEYRTTTYWNNVYSNIYLIEGEVNLTNFNIALSTYDIGYLTNHVSYINRFHYDQLKLDNSAQITLANIIKEHQNKEITKIQPNQVIRKIMNISPIRLSFLLIDDIYESGKPILYFQLVSQPIKQLELYSGNSISLAVDLYLDYFNYEIKVWEPVLENMSITLRKMLDNKNNTDTLELKLKDSRPAINISTHFLDLIFSYSQNAALSSNLKLKTSILAKAHFFIKNKTGGSLKIILTYIDAPSQEIILNDKSIAKVIEIKKRNSWIPATLSKMKIFALLDQNIVCLYDGEAHIQRFNEGYENKILKSKGLVDEGMIYINYIPNRAQDILTIHTKYTLKNLTHYNLNVKLCNKGRYLIKTLASHKSLNIPLDYCNGGFCIALDNKDMKKSVFSNLYIFDNTLVSSINIAKFVYMDVERKKYTHKQMDLCINPIFVLENRLLNLLRIQFKGLKHTYEYEIQPDEISKPVYLHLDDDYEVVVEFCDLKSNTIVFKGNESLRKVTNKKFKFFDATGVSIMTIYMIKTSTIPFKFIFYHKSYLINETFDDIVFTQKVLAHRIVPYKTDRPQILFMKNNEPLFMSDKDFKSVKQFIQTKKVGNSFYDIERFNSFKYEYSINISLQQVAPDVKIFSRIVHVLPKYVFINKTQHRILLSHSVLKNEILVKSNERKVFAISSKHTDNYLFKLRSDKSDWSDEIEFNKPDFFAFMLNHKFESYKVIHLTLEIVFSNYVYFVILNENQAGLFTISNKLEDINVLIYQDSETVSTFDYDIEIPSLKDGEYSWRTPMKQTNQFTLQFITTKERMLLGSAVLDTTKESSKCQIHLKNKRKIYMEMWYQGSNALVKLYDIFDFNNVVCPSTESIKPSKYIEIPNIGVSIIGGSYDKRKELLYINFNKIVLKENYKQLTISRSITIKYISIENMSHDHPIYPVMLAPRYSKKVMDEKAAQMLDMEIDIYQTEKSGLLLVSLIKLDLFAVILRIEEDILNNFYELFTEISNIQEDIKKNLHFKYQIPENTDIKPLEYTTSWKNYELTDIKPTYFQNIMLSPIEIIISFKKNLTNREADPLIIYKNLLTALGVFVTNIEDFPLALPPINILHETNSLKVLKDRIMDKYKTVIFNSALKLVGSLNLIGNPMTFINEVGDGVTDLVKNTREQGGKGLFTGTGSLMKHTAAGTFGSLNKMTRTLGDGVISLTTDKEFLTKREKLYSKPQNKFLTGLQQLGYGIYDGFTGLVIKPIEGTKKQGFRGALKGTYKGISGLFLKPITGVLDMASASADGLRNLSSSKKMKSPFARTRNPRLFYTEKKFYKAYEEYDNLLNDVIVTQEGYHIVLIENVNLGFDTLLICLEGVVLMTERKIMWRKNVDSLVGCVEHENNVSIEYFDLINDKVELNSYIIDVKDADSAKKIVFAVLHIIEHFNQKLTSYDQG